MTICFSKVLTDIDGDELKREDGTPLTLAYACRVALMNAKGVCDAATHLDRYDLGCTINCAVAGAYIEITNRQLQMLRDSVSAIWTTGVAAPALNIFAVAEAAHNKTEAVA